MVTRRSRRLFLTVCALVSALTLAGCGGDGEKKDDAEASDESGKNSKAEMVRMEQTCGGVFDKETVAEATKPPGPERVRQGKAEAPSAAAAALTKETTWGTGHDLCVLLDGKGNELLSLDVAWVGHRVPHGKSVRTMVGEPIGGNAAMLEVRCELEGKRRGDNYALEFALRDEFAVSAHSHAKLLIATAKKVTSAMDCREQPDYPDPETVAASPKPDESTGKVAR
ncbi:hypothetical protein DVA86_24870 [Streptomyces armeniacus]|uniref:DUF3558 domain-containing protein n=1 Tax=Streptomyces armeniacus TaxID=83291 RepID=A0A345XUT3_9ACTN|nr:hypothetical protein [Streptomyces armeniacus]AXK35399.1 hypothetical protein DVA86_24870 [Streptomyces armeniacus]